MALVILIDYLTLKTVAFICGIVAGVLCVIVPVLQPRWEIQRKTPLVQQTGNCSLRA